MEQKDKFSLILEAYLKMKTSHKKMQKTKDCPGEVVLSGYIDSSLSASDEDRVFEHISNCLYCLETVVSTRRSKELSGLSEFEEIPKKAIDNVKELPRRYGVFSPSLFLKKNIWLIFAAISFILSFAIKRYFIQFTVATLILSMKWIFETGSTRTLIMVYNAWRKKDTDTLEETLGRFKDREQFKI